MKTLPFAVATLLMIASNPVLAFDAATQDIISRHKANKPVTATDVAELMRASERWCYDEQSGTCNWSDIYLDVTADGATYEIGNAWDGETDVIFTDTGVFKDNRYICETGEDWVPTLRAVSRTNGTDIGGRALWAIKQQLTANGDGVIDCFDYLYLRSDRDAQTITLLQRQYIEDSHDSSRDVEVTLHFDADNAKALTWRW